MSRRASAETVSRPNSVRFSPPSIGALPGAAVIKEIVASRTSSGRPVELTVIQPWQDGPLLLSLRIDGAQAVYAEMEPASLNSDGRDGGLRQSIETLFIRLNER